MSAATWDPFSSTPDTLKHGRYRLEQLLGEGDETRVHRAWDTFRRRFCAVKLLQVPAMGRREARVRFIGEARGMAQLRHPNVPRIFDAGREESFYWFAMEIAERGDLQALLHEGGPFSPREALRIVFEVLQALHAAHQIGLVHRNVHPHHLVMHSDGRILLTGFTIAHHPTGSLPICTLPGVSLGTLGYRAPEQEGDAATVGPPADFYGATATLYGLVTGHSPFGLWDMVDNDTLPRTIPEPLRRLMAQGAARRPSQRFQTARAMALVVAEAEDALAALCCSPSRGPRWMERFDALAAHKGSESGDQDDWVRRWLPAWAATALGLEATRW